MLKTKAQKLALLAATLVPMVYVLYLMTLILSVFLEVPIAEPPFDEGGIRRMFLTHSLTVLWSVLLIAAYFAHLFKNPRLSEPRRALWGVFLICGAQIGLLAYWFIHIWPDAEGPT